MKIKPIDFVPYVAIVVGVGIAGTGAWKWNEKRQEIVSTGRPEAGAYYNLVPDFSCLGRKKVRAQLTVAADHSAQVTTTNPLDCSELSQKISAEDLMPVGFSGNHLAYRGVVFQKFAKTPELMDGTPEHTEIWCRPAHDPIFDLFVDDQMETSVVRLEKVTQKKDHLILERALELPAQRTATTVTAEGLTINLRGDTAQAEFLSAGGKTNVNLTCLYAASGLHQCPAGFRKLVDICVEESAHGAASSRSEAALICEKLGRGFSLLGREDGRMDIPVSEWTREQGLTQDSAAESKGSANFRCMFREKPLPIETIFPDELRPNRQGPSGPIEVGIKFRSNLNGFVKAIRFYRAARDTAGYTVHLWDSKGIALVTTTGPGVTANSPAAGSWQTIDLNEPVAIVANVTYTASYYTAAGEVSERTPALVQESGRGLSLTATAQGGVAITNGGYPLQVIKDTDFMVDVVFEPVH